MPESNPVVPQLIARQCIPLDVEHYVVNYPIVPLATTSDAPTTTTTATTTTGDVSDVDHEAVIATGVVPPHLKLFYMPKVIREGSTCRIVQFRFLKSKNRFVWMSFAQPLLHPDPNQVKPRLRIPAPNLVAKFEVEDMMNFLRFYNIESDGSYYKAAIGDPLDARGYGEFIEGHWKNGKWVEDHWKTGKSVPPSSSKF